MRSFFIKLYKFLNRKINKKVNEPLTRNFGIKRGTPIDRYFINKKIEDFLESLRQKDKKYRVLEIGGLDYLEKNSDFYESFELVMTNSNKKKSNIICKDLNEIYKGEFDKIKKFDFIICTQVLNFVKNDLNALKVMYELLKNDGLIIGSVTGMISPLSLYDYKRWGAYRGYTDQGLRSIFEKANFSTKIETHGNFELGYEILNGSVVEDIKKEVLEVKDPLFQITHTFSASKN